MPIGLLFWLLFVLWLVFTFWTAAPFSSMFLLIVLIFLLGWKIFGFLIQG